jgi:tetratricopeptide (TPR) repeat protein
MRSPNKVAALLVSLALIALSGCEAVSARRKIQKGNKLYYDKQYAESIKLYDEALRSRPELDIGWYNLGLAHIALFQPGMKSDSNEEHAQGAIAAFKKYMELVPDDKQARDYLLSTYIDSGHYEGALAYFEDQLAKNPTDVEALAQLAQISSQAGKFDDAVKWHKKRVAIETSIDGKADAEYAIGVLQWKRLNNHPEVVREERLKIADEGLNALMEADKLRPNHGPTLSYANLMYRERALSHEVSYARAVETASAQVYQKRAMELIKGSTPQPAAPEAPPKK